MSVIPALERPRQDAVSLRPAQATQFDFVNKQTNKQKKRERKKRREETRRHAVVVLYCERQFAGRLYRGLL